MTLSQAIWIYLEPLFTQCLNEKDKKKEKELKRKIKVLNKEYELVLDKDVKDMINSGLYNLDDICYHFHHKKIISDKEYAELMEKWSKIVGEKLLYPEEQEYLDQKHSLIESMQGIMTPEEQEAELKKFEYHWTHRKEIAEDRKRLEQEHKEYVKMINNMTPEELEKFYEPEEDTEREKMYKSVSIVKTNDEE